MLNHVQALRFHTGEHGFARQRLFGRGRIAVVLSPRLRHYFETLGLDSRFLLADSRLHAVRLLGLGDPGAPRTHAPRPHAHAA